MKNKTRIIGILLFFCLLTGVVSGTQITAHVPFSITAQAMETGEKVEDGVVVAADAHYCGCCHTHQHASGFGGKISCIICKITSIFKSLFGGKEKVVHKYKIVSEKEPTCLKEGVVTLKCAVCGKNLSQKTEKLPHTPVKVAAQSPTCTKSGVGAGERCSVCGTNLSGFGKIPATGHKNGEAKKENEVTPTCTAAGGYDTVISCTVCGREVSRITTTLDATGHEMQKITENEPTCTEEGETVYACSKCGYSYSESIQSPGHSYISNVTAPTCTQDGVKEYTCERCNDSYSETIKSEGHSYIESKRVEATCTEDGTITFTCTKCGDTFEQTIPASGHNYKAEVTAPTCTVNGYTTHTCTKCGESFTDSPTVASGHNYSTAVLSESTCTVNGETEQTCLVCGEKVKQTLPLKAHTPGETVIENNTFSACDEESSHENVIYCTVCKSEISRESVTVAAAAHTVYTQHKDPSYTLEGYDRDVCSVCSKIISTTVIPVLTDTSEESLVCCYRVVDGKVKDVITGREMSGAVVEGDTFRGGTVVAKGLDVGSIELVMQYNVNSTQNPLTTLAYYGGAFLMLDGSSTGYVKNPFGGGASGSYYVTSPLINDSTSWLKGHYDYSILPSGEFSYQCLTFDRNARVYAIAINDTYVKKEHWSGQTYASFNLSSEHTFREVRVYEQMFSESQCLLHYRNENLNGHLPNGTPVVGTVTDGLTTLGPRTSYVEKVGEIICRWFNVSGEKGTHTVENGNGKTLTYTLTDYEHPDLGVDNSAYESVHIIKKPDTLYKDYKYALSAIPYPYDPDVYGKADAFDVTWSSSDTSVADIIDGLIVPKATGTVTFTATLTGTAMSDSVTIQIVEKEVAEERSVTLSADYISPSGYYFSSSDYEMTTRAIYEAIDEAYRDGCNHIIFPKISFFAAPIGEPCYIPTGMHVEFPEGSEFHMMPSDLAKTTAAGGQGKGYSYFRMGWPTWFDYSGYFYVKDIPAWKATAKKNSSGQVADYYCDNATLTVDKYFGEFYQDDITIEQAKAGADEYVWGCRFCVIGKNARFCAVEVRDATCTAGFFITMGGATGTQELADSGKGKVYGRDFVLGHLDDSGSIVADENWISTKDFFPVCRGADGTDPLDYYYAGNSYAHEASAFSQHLYDILWFDAGYNLIRADRWHIADENYSKPENAAYFKISVQQSTLPKADDEFLHLHPAGSAQFCEIRNTSVTLGADGMASVTGETEACWIHDNFVANDGIMKNSCWELDLEDGNAGIRGTVIEHNIFRKRAYGGNENFYNGYDSGILALSDGYNTFVISNYIGAVSQTWGNTCFTHIINNSIGAMYSTISGGKFYNLRAAGWAHVFYNNIRRMPDGENANANGDTFSYANTQDNNIMYY